MKPTKPKKKMQQQKLGAMKRQDTGDTPELRLTHAGTGAPVLQDPAILQHLSGVFASYGNGVREAGGRLSRASPAKRNRRQRRRSSIGGSQPSPQDDLEDDDPTLQMRGAHGRAHDRTADVQFDAGRYLEVLADYTSDIRLPAETDLLRLENVMRRHVLHDNEQPAQHAFRMLIAYIQRFPATLLQHYPADSPYAGVPFVEERNNCWTLLSRKRPVVLAEADMSEADMVTPDQFFFELWDGVKSLARSVEDADTVADHYGQVLLLRAVVAQLQAELAPRLAAFRDTAGTATAAKAAAGETGPAAQRRREGLTRHRRRLLEESHLWRLLAEVPIKGIRSRHELVGTLLAIIAEGADGPSTSSPEGGALVTAQELAGLAAVMLRLLLELYGTAEASGYYTDAAGRIRQEDRRNHRILLDNFLLEGFIGPDALVRGWEQKQVLLAALRPRDRLRLLGLVMAKRRVQRGEADARKYVSMQTARDLVDGTGDTPGFIDVDPAEVLSYIADDLPFAQTACNKSANDLALVASHVGRAAALFRPDQAGQVAEAFEQVSNAILARHAAGERSNVLSVNSQAELRGTGVLLLTAAAAA